MRGTAWADRGKTSLPLPALDMPVSKTGVVVYAPPGFRVTQEPGAFRETAYVAPSAAAFGTGRTTVLTASTSTIQNQQQDILQQFNSNAAQSASQTLVDRYKQKSEARTVSRPLPAGLSFPVLGSSMFFAAELTGETQAPKIDFNYEKSEKHGGVR